MTVLFYSSVMVGTPSKGQLFMMDALKWASEGFVTWIISNSRNPMNVRLRENKEYAHEVAAKLIEEKRQDLKDDGSFRRDALSLLGSSTSPF